MANYNRKRYRKYLFEDVPMPKRTQNRRQLLEEREIEEGDRDDDADAMVTDNSDNNDNSSSSDAEGSDNEYSDERSHAASRTSDSSDNERINNDWPETNSSVLPSENQSDNENIHQNQDNELSNGESDEELAFIRPVIEAAAEIVEHHEDIEENGIEENIPDQNVAVENQVNEEDNNVQVVEDDNAESDPGENTDDEPDDEAVDDQDRTLLYDGARISRRESEFLIMSFLLRYSLPDKSLEDLLHLVNCHMPQKVYSSKYLFKKKFPEGSVQQHFFCSSCDEYLNIENEQEETTCICGVATNRNELKRAGKYFLTNNISERIKDILTDDNVARHLRRRENETSDVTSGRLYKRLVDSEMFGNNDITLQWNTDGANVFKSSNKSLWPIQISINELPYTVRKNNMILAGLWIGEGSPRMDVFLKPFIEELNDLHREGITCSFLGQDNVTVKVHCLIASVDSVARPKLQNMIQFNGRFGCPYCLNEGETVEKGKGFVRIYKPMIGELRDARQLEENAESAVLQNKPVNGVKGFSLLLLLQIFDIIRSFVPDYMHAVLLGVVRAICEIWFNSKYSNSPWYIGLRSNEVSQRLMGMKPTSEISRTPSSIDKRALWKALEWRTFLLYYSLPALRGILPEKYCRHWFLLVFAFQTLLKNKVTSAEIDASNLALQTFVKQAEILYGKEHLSFNMHLLLHTPRYVKDWGSPWASSAFMYEHGNGVLVRLFNGSQSVVDQIFRAYELTCYLQRVGPRIFNENSFEPAVKLFGKLMGDEYCVQKCSRELNNNLVIFGRAELFTASPQVLIRIENIFGRNTFGDILRSSSSSNKFQSFHMEKRIVPL